MGVFLYWSQISRLCFPRTEQNRKNVLGRGNSIWKAWITKLIWGGLEGQQCSSSNTKYFYLLVLASFCPPSPLPSCLCMFCFPFHSMIVCFDAGFFSWFLFYVFIETWLSCHMQFCCFQYMSSSDCTALGSHSTCATSETNPVPGSGHYQLPPTPAQWLLTRFLPLGSPALDVSSESNCTVCDLWCLAASPVSSMFQHDWMVFYFIDVPHFYLFIVSRCTLLVIVGSVLCTLVYKCNAFQILVFSETCVWKPVLPFCGLSFHSFDCVFYSQWFLISIKFNFSILLLCACLVSYLKKKKKHA